MFYRILALTALFFLTACGGTKEDMTPAPIRKQVAQTPPSASAQPAPAAQPEGRIVKIGLLVPLTGEAASVGAALQDAATLALMDRYGGNENQPVKVVMVPKDTQGTPEGAARAAQEALQAGAQLIVGPLYSTSVGPVAQVAQRQGVNVLTFSNNPEVAGRNVFVFGFLVDQQVDRILNYALNRNLPRIGILAPNNAYGLAVQKSAKRVLSSSSLLPAAEAYYNPNAAAPAMEIDAIAARHVESPLSALLLPESGQKLRATVEGLTAKGIAQPDVRLLGTGLWDDASLLNAGYLNGAWFASSPPERFATFEKRFNEFFGYSPPRISALAYDALALASSLAANSPDGRITARALTDEAGYNGPVNGLFRCKDNGICERGLAVLEVTRNGARVIDAAPKSF